jgi:hypothetical protein
LKILQGLTDFPLVPNSFGDQIKDSRRYVLDPSPIEPLILSKQGIRAIPHLGDDCHVDEALHLPADLELKAIPWLIRIGQLQPWPSRPQGPTQLPDVEDPKPS